MSDEYQWSDIWLLQSIILGGGDNGADLCTIISTGDGLNHAIFTNDELESGFSRLTSGGLIFEKNTIFSPTEKAREIYKEAEKSGDSIYSVRKRLGEILKSAPYDPDGKYPNPENNLSYPGFSPEAVEEAIKKWHQRAKELIEGK